MTVGVLWLFLAVLWIDLQCVNVVFPDHTHFLTLLSSDVSVMETNVSQSPPFFKSVWPSQHALQSSSYFGNYERCWRSRFSRIVGNTHSKSPFRLKMKQNVS